MKGIQIIIQKKCSGESIKGRALIYINSLLDIMDGRGGGRGGEKISERDKKESRAMKPSVVGRLIETRE